MNLFCNCSISDIIPYEEKQHSNKYLKKCHNAFEIALIDSILIRLIKNACEVFGGMQCDFKSKSRKRDIVMSRQIVAYILWKNTRMTLAQIGERIGRDHATVLFSHEQITNLLETDKSFKVLYLSEFKKYENEMKEVSS